VDLGADREGPGGQVRRRGGTRRNPSVGYGCRSCVGYACRSGVRGRSPGGISGRSETIRASRAVGQRNGGVGCTADAIGGCTCRGVHRVGRSRIRVDPLSWNCRAGVRGWKRCVCPHRCIWNRPGLDPGYRPGSLGCGFPCRSGSRIAACHLLLRRRDRLVGSRLRDCGILMNHGVGKPQVAQEAILSGSSHSPFLPIRACGRREQARQQPQMMSPHRLLQRGQWCSLP